MKYFSADAVEKLRTKVLEDAVEDYTGIWELVPQAERILGPSSLELIVATLREVVLDLATDGLVSFYEGNPQPSDAAMDAASAASIISHDAAWAWETPAEFPSVWIGALPKGERAYKQAGKPVR